MFMLISALLFTFVCGAWPPAGATGSCSVQNDCQDGEFCYKPDADTTGTCYDCAALNADSSEEQGCLSFGLTNQMTATMTQVLSCLTICTGGNIDFGDAIPGPSISDLVPTLLTDLEGSGICTFCCTSDGGVFQPMCLGMYADNPCVETYCGDASTSQFEETGRCYYRVANQGAYCPLEGFQDADDNDVSLPGVCVDGQCVWTTSASCPEGGLVGYESHFDACGSRVVYQDFAFEDEACPTGSNGQDCDQFGPQWKDIFCWGAGDKEDTDSGAAFSRFDIHYLDPYDLIPDDVQEKGRCIIGNEEGCVIEDEGYHTYRDMQITFMTGETEDHYVTMLHIPSQTKVLAPYLSCKGDQCRGTINCQMEGSIPCGETYVTCVEAEPTSEPSSGHGDPIIWTFDGECYDLNIDGQYLASHHPEFDHDVKISIYNDYMREIQVTNLKGEILLSISNMGEVINNNFPFFFTEETKVCPDDETDCQLMYKEFKFDAQNFEYTVQVLVHDYLDPALREGEFGKHLDIFPKPYEAFLSRKDGYSGLYFENPLPEELSYCEGGSPQRKDW